MKLLFLAFGLLLSLLAVAHAAEKPNVLLILADDMRGDIGAFGNAMVKTPALDRLAARAVRFEPLLAKPDAAWDRPAFTIVPVANKSGSPDAAIRGRSVRTECWRYTEFGQGEGARQLFDHAADPHELNNLAADSAHAATVAEMKALLHRNPSKP